MTSGHNQKVTRYFPSWEPEFRLWHIVKVVESMFATLDLENPVNPGAAALYNSDQPAYEKKVAEYVALAAAESSKGACSTVSFEGIPHKDKVINAMLEWGAEGALDSKRIRKLAEQGNRLDAVGEFAALTDIRVKIRATHGAAVEVEAKTSRLKLAEDGCRGWLDTKGIGDDADWTRSWCVIGNPPTDGAAAAAAEHGSPATAHLTVVVDESGTPVVPIDIDPRYALFTQYETETEETMLDQCIIGEICSAYQPPTAEMKANNTFLVVAPDSTWQFRAASEKEVLVWLDVLRTRCSDAIAWHG
jgi:hypothetical protein